MTCAFEKINSFLKKNYLTFSLIKKIFFIDEFAQIPQTLLENIFCEITRALKLPFIINKDLVRKHETSIPPAEIA